MDVKDMAPHDGNLGTSGWVLCQAPCCGSLHGDGPGWFAIKAGEPHYFDPRTRWHWHGDCYAEMVRREQERDEIVARYLRKAV